MPGDGMEPTAVIREREEFVSTPIVFLSGRTTPSRRTERSVPAATTSVRRSGPKHPISAVTNRLPAPPPARRSQL